MRDHAALDPSQRAAVQLCSDSRLAFVWGPPGTGKTVTLTHVIEELLAQDRRILLVSTTNAAIDEVLAKLSTRPWFATAIEAGTLVRLGRSSAETFGAELGDVVARKHDVHGSARSRLRARIDDAEQRCATARGSSTSSPRHCRHSNRCSANRRGCAPPRSTACSGPGSAR